MQDMFYKTLHNVGNFKIVIKPEDSPPFQDNFNSFNHNFLHKTFFNLGQVWHVNTNKWLTFYFVLYSRERGLQEELRI